ncbi:MAG: kelch repeat-containing protein [Geothrix sp.]|uniref:Kelch repeat-containing protein n=1 Tax=Geothrix sp. TaxID=1962974 RepID=UPI003BAFA0B8
MRTIGSICWTMLVGLALFSTACKEVAVAPTGLSYGTNPAIYTVGTAIPTNSPTHGGGNPDTYSISPSLPDGLVLDPKSGAMTGTPTTPSAATSFTVTATNGAGSTTASLTITVNAKPPAITITTQPASQSVQVGQTATFTVVANGTGTLSYQWAKGGIAIAGAASASYTTPATVLADDGSSFTVDISDTNGNVLTSSAAILTVTTVLPVTITTQPADQSVLEGQTATFSVVASGSGTLTYQWSKDGVAIPSATAASYTTPTTVLADSGSTYSVHITAGNGQSATSTSATLTVLSSSGGPGTCIATGSLTTLRHSHTATLLANGKVLIVGGFNGIPLDSAELYDPTSGTFSSAGNLASARYSHTATLLPNGKVLVTGGYTLAGVTKSAELYDPGTNSFSVAGTMVSERAQHTATSLPGGKVLIFSGRGLLAYLKTAELYDPTTNAFTATVGAPLAARVDHTASLLGSGKVLITGGQTTGVIASGELYDPVADTFTATASLSVPRVFHTATVLANGKVLVVGGSLTSVAELYDPAAGTFTATAGTLVLQRDRLHAAVLLPTGKVLISGGVGSGVVLAANELFDPANGTFAATGSMTTSRRIHTATLLGTGKVLLAAGLGGTYLFTAELYY